MRSIAAQVSPATAPAMWVTMKALTARPPADKALPALKPNHPNQSRPARSRRRGDCGAARSTRGSPSGAEEQGAHEGRDARVDVDHDAAREVDAPLPAELTEPRKPFPPHTQWATGS